MEYISHREGLVPFVLGLFEGLGELFGTPVIAQHQGRRGEGELFKNTTSKSAE